MNLSPYTLFLGGLIIGTGLTMATMPAALSSKGCETYRVSHKVATAYVLRPPPAVPAAPLTCPVAVAPAACPPVDKSEDVTPVDEPKKTHHRRHHRRRAYWR